MFAADVTTEGLAAVGGARPYSGIQSSVVVREGADEVPRILDDSPGDFASLRVRVFVLSAYVSGAEIHARFRLFKDTATR